MATQALTEPTMLWSTTTTHAASERYKPLTLFQIRPFASEMSSKPPHPRYWAAVKTAACFYTLSTDPDCVPTRTSLLGSYVSEHHV